jgi:hypothetical protein
MGLIKSAKQLISDFAGVISRRVEPEEKLTAQEFFNQRKKEIINQIKDHPVSQELRSHIMPSPILGAGVKSSLYGFLGFVAGTKPVDIVLDIVEKKMSYTVKKKLFGRGLKIDITFPTIQDFRVPELTLNYEGGGNFIETIEKGASGLQYYIKYTRQAARSREGIQAKKPVRSNSLGPIPYLTPILKSAEAQSKAFSL